MDSSMEFFFLAHPMCTSRHQVVKVACQIMAHWNNNVRAHSILPAL